MMIETSHWAMDLSLWSTMASRLEMLTLMEDMKDNKTPVHSGGLPASVILSNPAFREERHLRGQLAARVPDVPHTAT
jgi:hypothetical protein